MPADEIARVVELIGLAFPPVPLDPDDDRDGWQGGTINTTELMSAVRGRCWNQLDPALLERHHDALTTLGQRALVAVLPAFLVATLRHAPELHLVPTFLIGVLTREPATSNRFDARLAPLGDAQRRAIARALAVLEALPGTTCDRAWIREARESYWRDFE